MYRIGEGGETGVFERRTFQTACRQGALHHARLKNNFRCTYIQPGNRDRIPNVTALIDGVLCSRKYKKKQEKIASLSSDNDILKFKLPN